MSGRDEQLGRGKDEPESRQQTARDLGEEPESPGSAAEADERPEEEQQAEADLLKSTGGDPFTQESD